MDILQDDKVHTVRLGETFKKNCTSAFHTVRCKYVFGLLNHINYCFIISGLQTCVCRYKPDWKGRSDR